MAWQSDAESLIVVHLNIETGCTAMSKHLTHPTHENGGKEEETTERYEVCGRREAKVTSDSSIAVSSYEH